MSFLKKSLQKRIYELRQSIETQTTELAAYEEVLALETGKPTTLAPAPAAVAALVQKHSIARKTVKPMAAESNGSRSDFVASMLKQRGAAGVTPSEISAAFASHKIAVGKNLVYNVLSLMFKQKKVRKSGGRYFLVSAGNGKSPSPATKKRRISEEGMRRIIAATKKRWARAKATQKSR